MTLLALDRHAVKPVLLYVGGQRFESPVESDYLQMRFVGRDAATVRNEDLVRRIAKSGKYRIVYWSHDGERQTVAGTADGLDEALERCETLRADGGA